jgi:hypothetical protein
MIPLGAFALHESVYLAVEIYLVIGKRSKHADRSVRRYLDTADDKTLFARGTNGSARATFFELDFACGHADHLG